MYDVIVYSGTVCTTRLGTVQKNQFIRLLYSGFEAKSQGEEPDAPDAAGSAPVQTTPVTPFTPVGQGKCNFQCPDLRGPEKAVCVAVSEQ